MTRRILLEIVSSILVAFIADFIIKQNEISFAIGVLTFLVVETVSTNWYLEKLVRITEAFSNILNSFEEKDEYSNLYVTELISYIKKTKKNISNGIVEINEEGVPNFWVKTVRSFELSYWATSYVEMKIWDVGTIERANEIQKEQIKKGKTIRRVFIIENHKELEIIKRIMQEQHLIGIKTKYVFISQLQKISSIQKYYSKLQSYDFAIADNRYLTIILLDKTRRIRGAKFINDLVMLDIAKNLYLLIWDEAEALVS